MSLGAQMAGIDIRLAVEIDKHAAATYSANFPNVRMFNDDIRCLTALNVDAGDQPKVLFGGPPCQGFSISNRRNRHLLNPRNWLYDEFIRIARLWEPDWIVFENVKGITEIEEGDFLTAVLEEFERIGYTPSSSVLNAVDFGVPQKRSRLFIVASRHGVKFTMPTPNLEPPLSVEHAFRCLPCLPNGHGNDFREYEEGEESAYSLQMRGNLDRCSGHLVTRNAIYVVERYAHIVQGGNWENIPLHLMANYADRNRCHTGIYHRLQAELPSIVIGNYRKNMLIHPTQHRGLSVREAARLQSFPDHFQFCGSIGFQQQQVGNAVPPLLANAVFEALVRQ